MTIGELNVEIGAKLDRLERGLSDMDNSMQQTAKKTSQQWSQWGAKIGGIMAGAFAVDKILTFGKESIALAGKLEGVEAAFRRLNNPMLLSQLRAATRGTVSDLELMQQAVRAQNFKVPLDQLATYFEFATKRAAQTGESVDYLVNSIIDGIGRKSTLVLDNLGISATELQDEMKKTGDFGAAAGNIIQRELEKAGDVALTTAQKTAQLNAQLENQKAILGQQLVPVYHEFLTVASGVIEYLSQLFDSSLSLKERLALLNPTTAATAVAMNHAKKAALESAEAFNAQAEAVKNLNSAMSAGGGGGRERQGQVSLPSKGIPSLGITTEGLKIMEVARNTMGEIGDQVEEVDIISSGMGSTLFNALVTSTDAAEDFGQRMATAIKEVIVELTKAIARMLLLRVLFKGIFGGLTGGLGLGIPSIPGLAKGGIVTGPTLAMIGEGRESEAVMPLSKLDSMMRNSGGGGITTARIVGAGDDLIVYLEKAQARRKNFVR